MNRLAEIIFNKSIDEVSTEALEQLTNKYPFFNAGHLLLLKKAKKENTPVTSQKASLHFHPLLFNETSVVTNLQTTFSNPTREILEQVRITQPASLIGEQARVETQTEITIEETKVHYYLKFI